MSDLDSPEGIRRLSESYPLKADNKLNHKNMMSLYYLHGYNKGRHGVPFLISPVTLSQEYGEAFRRGIEDGKAALDNSD